MGWSDWLADLLLFSPTTISRVYTAGSQIEQISSLWAKMPCWCERRMCGLVQMKCNSNSNNHWLQPRNADYHLWTQPIEPEKMSYSSRPPHSCSSYHPRRGTSGYNSQTHQMWTIGNTFSCSFESLLLLWYCWWFGLRAHFGPLSTNFSIA